VKIFSGRIFKILQSLISAERPLGRLLRLPLRIIPKGTIVPILATAAKGKHWIAGSGPHSCWLGFNEFTKRRLLAKEVYAGSVVYDIGANVGSYTILASVLTSSSGQVVAFEPMKDNLDYLRKHIQLNKLENVHILDTAVSDKSGEMRFKSHPDHLQGRLDPTGDHIVRITTLDEYINSPGARPPNFLKIDVEGGEAAVLRGAMNVLSNYKPVIFLSTHGQEVQRECERLLSNAGYKMSLIGRDPSEWIVRHTSKK